MLKFSGLLFASMLFLVAGIFHNQRTQAESQARYLLLNFAISSDDNIARPSQVNLLHPHGHVTQKWRDDLPTHTATLYWSPDEKWLYFAGFTPENLRYRHYKQTSLMRFNVETQQVEVLGKTQAYAISSTTGRWAYVDSDSLMLINDENVEIAATSKGRNLVGAMDWVYYIARDPLTEQEDIYRIHYDGTEREQLTNTAGDSEFIMSIAPDGQALIYSVSSLGNFNYLDINTGQATLFATENIYHVTWSPDGKKVIFARENKPTIFLTALDTLVSQDLFFSEDFISDLIWSADGQWLYYTSSNRYHINVYRFHLATLTREHLYQFGKKEVYTTLAWSPTVDKNWHHGRLVIGGALILLGLFAVLSVQRLRD